MKTTKKLLSLVLAIIMVLAVSPMAFAYNTDMDAFMKIIGDVTTYRLNIYEPVGGMSSEDIRDRISEAYSEAVYKVDEEASVDLSWLEENPEKAEALFKELNAVTAKIEESIAEEKLVVRVDSSKCYPGYVKIFIYEDEFNKLFSSEDAVYQKALDSYGAAMDLLLECSPEEVTQEMFDEAVADWYDFWVNCIACIEGRHELDYIVNEDGTHYSYCDFCKTENVEEHTFEDGRCVCGAEEPVIEDNTDTGASVSFIQRIIDFFRSLFDKILSLFK